MTSKATSEQAPWLPPCHCPLSHSRSWRAAWRGAEACAPSQPPERAVLEMDPPSSSPAFRGLRPSQRLACHFMRDLEPEPPSHAAPGLPLGGNREG